MKNYNENAEKNLIEMIRQKEEADKRLLDMEIVIVIISLMFMFSMIAIASLIEMQYWIRGMLIAMGIVQFLVVTVFALRIEQKAGYYVCAKCGHKYVPTFASVNMATHIGRTRFMKCPECGKMSWQKKVISKE